MPGRKAKPTALKEVQGNPGKRALNGSEPKPKGEAVRPAFVKGNAARIWNEYAPQLTLLGVLTAVDAHTFAAWCCLAAELEQGAERMTASRIAQMRALGSSFGLDASARARLVVERGNDSEDPAEKYFQGITIGPGNSIRQ